MNPINPNTYAVLETLYSDLANVFTSDMFHMGGDEVKFDCWKADPGIQQWLSDNGLSGELMAIIMTLLHMIKFQ